VRFQSFVYANAGLINEICLSLLVRRRQWPSLFAHACYGAHQFLLTSTSVRSPTRLVTNLARMMILLSHSFKKFTHDVRRHSNSHWWHTPDIPQPTTHNNFKRTPPLTLSNILLLSVLISHCPPSPLIVLIFLISQDCTFNCFEKSHTTDETP